MLKKHNGIFQKKILLEWFFLLVICLAFASCAGNAEKAKEKIELGQKYLLEMNYTEAMISFSDAIKLDPKNADLYVQRGDVYIITEQYEEAIADFDKAIHLGTAEQATKEEIESRIKKAITLGINKEMECGGFDSTLAWLENIGYSSFQIYNDLKEIEPVMDSIMEMMRNGKHEAVYAKLEQLSASGLFGEMSVDIDQTMASDKSTNNTLLEEYGLAGTASASAGMNLYSMGSVELRKVDTETDKLLTLVGYDGEMMIDEDAANGEIGENTQLALVFYGSREEMKKAGEGMTLGYASVQTDNGEWLETMTGDGSYADDSPNGQWNIAYNINGSERGQTIALSGSASGTMLNGVWDGPFTMTSEQTEQGTHIKFTMETVAVNGRYDGETKYTIITIDDGDTTTSISEGTLKDNEPVGIWTTTVGNEIAYRHDYDTDTTSFYIDGYGWMTESDLQRWSESMQ